MAETAEKLSHTLEPFALPFGEGDIEMAMAAYMEFLQLPETIKNQLWYPGDARRRNTSAGYVHKSIYNDSNQIDTSQDNKHVFQYTNDVRHMAEMAWPQHRPSAMRAFLDIAAEVHQAVGGALKSYFHELEPNYPALVGVHFPENGVTNHHLRFLAYEPSADGILAAGHYDKSTATVAVAESHGGLRLGESPDDLALYERDPAESVLFHGLGWLKLMKLLGQPTDRLPAWHDVINLEDRQVSDDILRWALIFFANPAYLDTAPSKVETHTPLDVTRLGNLALTELVAA